MKPIYLFFVFIIILSPGCKKGSDPAGPPTVTTTAVTEVTSTSAKGGGSITADGGAAITAGAFVGVQRTIRPSI